MTEPRTTPDNPAASGDGADNLREQYAAAMWAKAEHTIIAEWICCEPLNPKHDLCAQGYAALRMTKALIVDDPKAATSAPLADAVLGVRDQEMEQLRARVTELEQQLADADGELTEAREHNDRTCEAVTRAEQAEADRDRVRAATSALETQAIEFTRHHNPACECSWGEALDQATTRIRAALDQPQQPTTEASK